MYEVEIDFSVMSDQELREFRSAKQAEMDQATADGDEEKLQKALLERDAAQRVIYARWNSDDRFSW